ncbi:hypothetical protein XENOCAPTIV_018871 [Xenoophorus captivus]|uniref:Uncharacterized protein n=1 Tax=Xenoophorus captivus TaxID=1517983 RepID=A0ABV0RI16_9TELE
MAEKFCRDMWKSGRYTYKHGVTVATVVGVPPVTFGLPVQNPALSVSVVVSLGKRLHPPCLLMVVRGLGGACVLQLHFCQSAPDNGRQCSLPLSLHEWVDE